MKSVVLYSGGKDSTMALYHALRESEVLFLLSMVSENSESHMYHVPNIRLTRLLSEAVGIPLIEAETEGVEEEDRCRRTRTAMDQAAERQATRWRRACRGDCGHSSRP